MKRIPASLEASREGTHCLYELIQADVSFRIISTPDRLNAQHYHVEWLNHTFNADQHLSAPWQLGYQKSGQPVVISSKETGHFISRAYCPLNHDTLLCALGLAQRPIGIDVEKIDDHIDIPWNMLTTQEKEILDSLPKNTRALIFIQLWTLKEAYLKACGTGLLRAPEEICGVFQEGYWSLKDDRCIITPTLNQTIVLDQHSYHVCVVVL